MKRKINIDRPHLSSQEIASRQDFSSLIKQLPKVTKPPIYKTGWFITTVASVAGIAVITTNFILNDKTSTPNQDLATSTVTEAPLPHETSENISIKEVNTQDNSIEVSFVSNTEAPVETNFIEPTTNDKVTDEPATISEQQITQLKEEISAAKLAYDEAQNNRISFEANKPEQPINEGNPDRQFILDVDPKEFPEIGMYKNLLFEVEADDPSFSPTVYKQEWEDIKLETNIPGKSYYLSLSNEYTSKTFSVFPVYKGGDYAVAMTHYNKELEEYNALLQQKISEEEKLEMLYQQSLDELNQLTNQETNLSKAN